MSVFDHDGIHFHYERTGTGPPIIFCHGLTSSSTAIRELLGDPGSYSLVTWDCRGHGQTEPLGPPEAFCFERFAADLHALLRHLDIRSAIVGGVSMGAGVATRFALDYPETVESLILIRPAWLDRPSPEPLRAAELVGEYLNRFGAEEGRKRFETHPILAAMRAVDPIAARSLVESFEEPQAWERRVRLERIPRTCPIGGWSELARLTMPALVIGCEPDYVHPIAYAREWASRLPSATFVQVPCKATGLGEHYQGVREAISCCLPRGRCAAIP